MREVKRMPDGTYRTDSLVWGAYRLWDSLRIAFAEEKICLINLHKLSKEELVDLVQKAIT